MGRPRAPFSSFRRVTVALMTRGAWLVGSSAWLSVLVALAIAIVAHWPIEWVAAAGSTSGCRSTPCA
jgi:hypothetical protein